MKALFVLAACTSAAALSACAPAQLTRADVDGRVVCNVDKMDQVEREAARKNRQVIWVNCPQAVLRAG